MPFMQDPEDLPPEVKAQIERAEALQKKALAMEVEHRRQVLRFAAVMCTCLRPDGRFFGPRPDDYSAYPSYGCAVHGSQMITPDGRLIG